MAVSFLANSHFSFYCEYIFCCRYLCYFCASEQIEWFMHKILVEGIKVYAYHGCLEEEGRIGANYLVDVVMKTDFSLAAQTDDLTKTIDYVVVYEIVKRQMAIRSKLIEQVGQRIVDELKGAFQSIQELEVKVTKLNPPMNGNVERVSIVISA